MFNNNTKKIKQYLFSDVYLITITIKRKIMNLSFKNFKKLSERQIKTYAAILMMSAFTVEATALVTEVEANPVAVMEAAFETVFEAELEIENWMLSPFEAIPEMDLALESWMIEPFKLSVSEELSIENNICSPAP